MICSRMRSRYGRFRSLAVRDSYAKGVQKMYARKYIKIGVKIIGKGKVGLVLRGDRKREREKTVEISAERERERSNGQRYNIRSFTYLVGFCSLKFPLNTQRDFEWKCTV